MVGEAVEHGIWRRAQNEGEAIGAWKRLTRVVHALANSTKACLAASLVEANYHSTSARPYSVGGMFVSASLE